MDQFGYNTYMETSMKAFSGFSQQTFAFFMEIAFHNTQKTMKDLRGVFEDHILDPLRALSRACEAKLFEVDPKMDFRPVMGGTISRIRRDTRFSRNKDPYRDYMWLDFRRKNEDFHLGFCYSISPRTSAVFMGMHEATTQARNAVRTYVMLHANRYKQLHAELLAKGYEFAGEDYKRSMSDAADADVRAFGQKRDFAYRRRIPLSDTMRPAFAEELQGYIEDLIPMYQFFRSALN
jgi:uncharacterized protein (TIGR02453 family)